MRLDLCADSLDGLSVGDALGAQFFVPGTSVDALIDGLLPPPPWPWTDDTEMACVLVAHVRERGQVDQDELAREFSANFEPYRGYGGGAVMLLRQIQQGRPWREVSRAAFNGRGSMGNGAAMRVAPLGALHAGDTRTAAWQALLSAEITHAHPEAILGAVAVAVAAAEAGRARLAGQDLAGGDLLDVVLGHLTDSAVASGIRRAQQLLEVSVEEASYHLGNGSRTLAQDTVPLTLWVAATYLSEYTAAIHACIKAGGDVDTTAAIAGGIVATYTGASPNGIPHEWLHHREALPDDRLTER